MNEQEFGCPVCPDRHVCQAPCAWMEARLPSKPPCHREKTYGLWPESTLGRLIRPPSNGRLDRYRPLLSAREWEVLVSVYVLGRSQRRTARDLGLSRSRVRNALDRAHVKIATAHGDQNRL